ncbi:MAG: GGDEF domain-containing protein [Candidatus Accumulibacter sp.]|nr:GGDEF domain-containing protein [Accumulibacter sp.]
MTAGSPKTEHASEQLVRYEALFRLLDDLHALDDIAEIAKHVVRQWKYFANVANWRLVVADEQGVQLIDGCNGQVYVSKESLLSPWDEYHWQQQRPRLVRLGDPLAGPEPPRHLTGRSPSEILILPFLRMGLCIGLLSVSAGREPFNDLDHKFIRIFGAYFAERIWDIRLRTQATEVLINKATRDALTGLLNRGTIIERLGSALALSKRTGEPLSVIICDIDFFKIINDSHGHMTGDEVLRQVSHRLQAETRLGDSLGRYGGEEFLIVLYPCNARDAVQSAERFRHAIADTPVSIEGDGACDLKVTISLGTSSTSGDEKVRIEALLKRADDALYRSKAGGRNRVTAANEQAIDGSAT